MKFHTYLLISPKTVAADSDSMTGVNFLF